MVQNARANRSVSLATAQGMRTLGFLARLVVAVVLMSMVLILDDPNQAVPWIVAGFFIMAIAYRLDFINCWVAFAIPWLLILVYSSLPISLYSRPVGRETVFVIVMVLAMGLVLLPARISFRGVAERAGGIIVQDRKFAILLLIFLAFCAVNVALAGYVPLINAVIDGDSGYMAFGVKGVYGLFNAFANAFGLTAFYLWMAHPGKRLYKYSFFLVLAVFLLFVTRQNLMSLVVESLVVYCAVVRKISGLRLVFLAVLVLIGFGALGDLREGLDIRDLAAVTDDFLWLPKAFVWLFAYCYFNILNMDNVVVAFQHAPLYDGSSTASLLPSFLRPEMAEFEDFREVSTFTVESFLSPLYRDFGLFGVAFSFGFFCLAVRLYVRRGRRNDDFIMVTGYAVLYFCFLFSFFVNFWFYLPVIFQLMFFPLFRGFLFPHRRGVE